MSTKCGPTSRRLQQTNMTHSLLSIHNRELLKSHSHLPLQNYQHMPPPPPLPPSPPARPAGFSLRVSSPLASSGIVRHPHFPMREPSPPLPLTSCRNLFLTRSGICKPLLQWAAAMAYVYTLQETAYRSRNCVLKYNASIIYN